MGEEGRPWGIGDVGSGCLDGTAVRTGPLAPTRRYFWSGAGAPASRHYLWLLTKCTFVMWDYLNVWQFVTNSCNTKKQSVCPAFLPWDLELGHQGQKLQPGYRRR